MRSVAGCELCIGTAEELRYSCDSTNSIMNKHLHLHLMSLRCQENLEMFMFLQAQTDLGVIFI